MTVVSADKDLAQVLREGDVLLDPARERRLGYRDVAPAYGVRPEQVPDLLALTGDAVDNIPGVPGIGPKTAVSLLGTFASLDELYGDLDRLPTLGLRGAARIRRLLEGHREQAMLARELATVAEDAEVGLAPAQGLREALARRRPALAALNRFYDELGMGDALRNQAVRLEEAMAKGVGAGSRGAQAGDAGRGGAGVAAGGGHALDTHLVTGAGCASDGGLAALTAQAVPTTLSLFPAAGGPAGADDWHAIADAVRADGGPALDPHQVSPVSGGCIHGTYRVRGRGENGEAWYFVKRNAAASLPLLRAEAQGLRALAGADVVRVPRPHRCGVAGDNAYLVMEWIDLGRLDKAASRALGTALAHLHQVHGERFGWHEDNFIGATPQANGWGKGDDWAGFFRDRRLAPQLRLAHDQGYRGRLQQDGERLLARLDALFEGHAPRPSLLHGDLWAGNCAADGKGRPVLFDPAVHYGDGECDLAMTELFGGFDRRFYEAYHAVHPRAAGYERRRDVYQLYHVLNHLNLFGGGYLAHAERLLRALTREV